MISVNVKASEGLPFISHHCLLATFDEILNITGKT